MKEVERLHEACDDARKVQEDIKTQFAVEKETNQQLILEVIQEPFLVNKISLPYVVLVREIAKE